MYGFSVPKWLFAQTKKSIKVPIFKFLNKISKMRKIVGLTPLPNLLTFEFTKDVGVYAWESRDSSTRGGKERLRHPPSVFTDIPAWPSFVFAAANTASANYPNLKVEWSIVQVVHAMTKRKKARRTSFQVEKIKRYFAVLYPILPSVNPNVTFDLLNLKDATWTNEFSVLAYKKHILVPLRDIIRLISHKVEKYSKLNAILEKVYLNTN